MLNDFTIKQAANNDEKILIKKINDLCIKASRGEEMTSDFLDLRQQYLAELVVQNNFNISWKFDGGYLEAERKRLLLYPEWLDDTANNIGCVSVVKQGKDDISPGHRDYLGAILSLGIKREKMGDILLHEQMAYILLDKSLLDFVCMELDKVKKSRVKVQIINTQDLSIVIPDPISCSLTIASLRLDALLSGAFNISRSEAGNLIQGEKVRVNHRIVDKISSSFSEGEVLSVRGKGRLRVDEIGDLTRKGRLRIMISRW